MKGVRLNNGVMMPAIGFGVFQIPENETERAASDWGDYTSENGITGKTPRTGVHLRICAAYVPPSGVTIE